MKLLIKIFSWDDKTTTVGYDFTTTIEDLVAQGKVDCIIVSTEEGLSHLGALRPFFSNELGIDELEIKKMAEWNRFDNPEVSLIGLPNRRSKGKLKGVVLAASETSSCYKQELDNEFHFNVTFESLKYCTQTLKAKKIAMFHLTSCRHFRRDIANCVVGAIDQFLYMQNSPRLISFMFVGCCMEKEHFYTIENNDLMLQPTNSPRTSLMNGFEVVSFDLK